MDGTPDDTDSEEEGPTVTADPLKMLHSLTMLSETKADPEVILLLLSSITIKNTNVTPDSPGRKRPADTNDDRDKENKRSRQESQDTPNKTKRQSNEAGSSRDKEKNDQFKCHICNFVYKTEWRFGSHLKSHPDLCGIVILPDESRRFCCALCGNRYSNKANVKRHIHRNHKITNLKCDSKDSRESKCEKKDCKVNEEQEGTAGNSQSNNEGSEDTAKEPTEQPEVRNEQSCNQKERPFILENRLVPTVFCRECKTCILQTVFKAHQEQHKMNYDKVLHESYSEIIEEVPQEQNNNEMRNVPNNAQERVVSRDESTVDQTNNSHFSTTVEEGNEQGDQEETYATYDFHDGNHKIINLKCDSKDSRESKYEKKASKVIKEKEGTAGNSQSNNEGSEDTAKEPTEQPEVRNEQSCSQKERPNILENRLVTEFCRECGTNIVCTVFKAHQEQHKIDCDKVLHESYSGIIEEVPQEQNNNEMCNVLNNAQEGVVSRDESTVDQTNNSQFSTTVDEGNEQGDQEETYATYDDRNTVSTSGLDNPFSEEMEKDLKKELKKLFSDDEIIEISDDSDGEENITQPNSTSSLCNSTDLNDILKDGKENGNAITDDIVAPTNEANNEQHPKESTSNGNNDHSAKIDDTITPANEANNDTPKEAMSTINDDDNAKIGYIIAQQPKAANSKGNNDDLVKTDSIILPANEPKNKEQLRKASTYKNVDDNATTAHRTALECEADNEELKEARYNGNAKTDYMIAANEPSNEDQQKGNNSNIGNAKTDDTLITANERNIGQPDTSSSASNVIVYSILEEERRIKDILSRRDDGTEG